MENPHSFDTRGFWFAIKFLIVVIAVLSGVRYGTAIASDIILAPDPQLSQIEKALSEAEERRKNRPPEETRLLQKLRAYESTLSTRTIGTASIDTLSQAHESLIVADLAAMKLYLFENGHATSTFEILSKGKRGSRWETPTGLYKVETKEESHFSSIGEVHMPFSMQFFGNFFIHGWPYYPGGEPVPEGYSGGCIRLSTEDAAKVFAFAERGTPIFVSENGEEGSAPLTLAPIPVPKLSAAAYLVADIHTGVVYAEKEAETPYPIASITKLLTALVANETIHFDRTLTVNGDDRAQTDGTPGSIAKGDTFTVGELFYPLLMESNNAATYTLARYNGQENFVGWMNDKAKAIGMEKTHMEDPSGISPNNTSTANDLFVLLRYIEKSQSFILNLSREPKKELKAENGRKYTFANFNHFAGNPEFLGGKVGYTPEARETYASVWEIPLPHATSTIAIIILKSEDRKGDVEKLRAWFSRAVTP